MSELLFILTRTGSVHGKLIAKYSGILAPEVILRALPDIKLFLEEVKSKGWKYLFIEAKSKYSIEIEINEQPCIIYPIEDLTHYRKEDVKLMMSVELKLINLSGIKIDEVDDFKINISTNNFPRAVTIDPVKRKISYINDALWNWDDELINDQEKVSQALEVYEVVKWLIDEKSFYPDKSLDENRFKEILEKFNKIKN
ncbi:MAG: hypothetical protein RMI79_06150 [Nitrososphaerota archaeon]|nr:hypothetical protein [Candidatus Aenigmarchaeota archaeon]MDW8034491.1 hypothetical protein [Nitrososphaerota archaeon]